jgi:hypothetical protein
MKKNIAGAVLIGALFAVSGCGVSGQINDKRAPGIPGSKTFQVEVHDGHLVGPDEVWVTVPEHVWDKCHVRQMYPQCAG